MDHRNIDIKVNIVYYEQMKIQRSVNIADEIKPGRTLVLLGPRRVGKTTLLSDFIASSPQKVVLYQGDEVSAQHAFDAPDRAILQARIGSADILAIDEAQAIPNIGKSLKIINDTMPEVAILVTGSSSFELAGQVGEPLTGRKTTRYLLPVSVGELLHGAVSPQAELGQRLPSLLVYGMYPTVLTADDNGQRADFLRELVDSYLLKDILTYQEVKGSRVLLQLLVLLAYQIGNEVSLAELGSSLGIDKNTVARYLDLLEKSYIIFRLGGFSRNLRSEVTRTAKYYFYDVGARNAVINNFNGLELRNDVGKLWENFAIVERLKTRLYNKIYANQYFWRTWEKNEVDLVEEREGRLFGYELKWKDKAVKAPAEWVDTYGDEASWQLVTPATALDFWQT